MAKDVPTWDETEEIVESVPTFEDTLAVEETPLEEFPALKGKFIQGTSAGFSDELAGLLEAAGEAVGVRGAGTSMEKFVGSPSSIPAKVLSKTSLSPEGPGILNYQQLLEAYRRGRDLERGQLQRTEEEMPVASTIADIAGGVAMPIPGLGAAKTVSGAPKLLNAYNKLSMAKKAGLVGAGVGAAEGIGRTDSENVGDMALNATLGSVLGGVTGAAGGKLAEKLTSKPTREAIDELREEADVQALRSMGATSGDVSDTLEKSIKYGKPVRAGEFAIQEGIVDPLARPKEAYKKVIDKLSQVKQGYQTALRKFDDRLNIREDRADEIADTYFRQIDEEVQKGLGASDLVTKEMSENVTGDVSTLQREISAALQSRNPIEELQNLYVRYNDIYFSNVNNPTANARRIMRNKIKELQRGLVEQFDQKAFNEFGQLDDYYTKLLTLEQITKRSAGKQPTVGFGDLIKGTTAKLTGIPMVGELVTGASVASKKLAGKDITDVLSGRSAINKLKRANKMEKIAEGYEGSTRQMLGEAISPETAGAAGIGTISAAMDTTSPNEPYKRDKIASGYIKDASPESLMDAANTVREQYGNSGDKLVRTLEQLSKMDKHRRNALIFGLLQDPNNRRMLGLNEEE